MSHKCFKLPGFENFTFGTFIFASIVLLGCKANTSYIYDTIEVESTWDGNCGSAGQPGNPVSIIWNPLPSANMFSGSCGVLGSDCEIKFSYQATQGEGLVIIEFFDDEQCQNYLGQFNSTIIPFNTAPLIGTKCNESNASYFNYHIIEPSTLPEVLNSTQIITAINPKADSSVNYCSEPLSSLGTAYTTIPVNFCLPCP